MSPDHDSEVADGGAPAASPSGHLAIFNRPEFQQLNVSAEQRLLRYDHLADGRLVGSLSGVAEGDVLISGHSAPFGGPDFVRDSETTTNVVAMLRAAMTWAAAEGVTTLHVKAKPDFYSASESAVLYALLNLGFTVEGCELNYHIDLTGMAGADDYVTRLKPPARRALKHAADEPYAFSEAVDDAEWRAAYGILDRNRRAKGRHLRLSLDYLLRVRDLFPRRVRMYLLGHGAARCAAALVYRVTPRRDLVVYWGDADHDLPRSPMNVLVHRLVAQAIGEGVLSLDAGTSTVDGVPDQGLIQFKESVLARPRLRLNLVRQL